MELAFESEALRTVCENEDLAYSELGPTVSGQLRRRLADILAADSIDDLVAGNPRLEDNAKLVLELGEGYEMNLTPNHRQNPVKADGSPDWPKVSRLRLLTLQVQRR